MGSPALVRERVPTWLIAALPGGARAARVRQLIDTFPPDERLAVVLEGLPADGVAECESASACTVIVIAPGCPCCIGQLTLRVTLARVLRLQAPRRLVIGIADVRHEKSLASLLGAPPWHELLELQTIVTVA